MMPALGRARLGLLVAVCLAGEVAPPLLVRTPKKKARGVAVGPSGEALAASVGRGLFEDRSDAQPKGNGSDGRSLRDRITAPPTSYPTVTYGGVLDAPLILPPSGAMNAAVGVTFLHSLPDITIHCTQDGSTPTRWSPRYQSGGMIHMSGTADPTLTLRCLARAPERPEQEFRDSAVVTRTYEVQMGTYDYDRSGYTGRVGMAFLVPYYRGQNYIDTTVDYAPAASGHSGKLPSIDLNTSTYKSVRIHGVDTDFAEYYTYDYKGEAAPVMYMGKMVPATLQYQRGTGAYAGQVRIHDIPGYVNDTTMRGFFHGFVMEHKRRNSTLLKRSITHYHRRFLVDPAEFATAVAKFGCAPQDRRDPVGVSRNTTRVTVETYGFLAPYFDGVAYSGKAARLRLGTVTQVVELSEVSINVTRCCVINVTKELCVLNSTVREPLGKVTLESVEDYRAGNVSATDPDGDDAHLHGAGLPQGSITRI